MFQVNESVRERYKPSMDIFGKAFREKGYLPTIWRMNIITFNVNRWGMCVKKKRLNSKSIRIWELEVVKSTKGMKTTCLIFMVSSADAFQNWSRTSVDVRELYFKM